MSQSEQVLTGALAILTDSEGNIIGKGRGITVNQNIQRQYVRGIGEIRPSEGAVTQWAGTVTFDQIFVNYNESGVPGALKRYVDTNLEFDQNLILKTMDGTTVRIYKRVSDTIDSNGKVVEGQEPMATIDNMLIESESLTINEGALVGNNQTFGYLSPIIIGSGPGGAE